MAVLGTSKKKVTTCFLFARFFVEIQFFSYNSENENEMGNFRCIAFLYILGEGPLQSNSVA